MNPEAPAAQTNSKPETRNSKLSPRSLYLALPFRPGADLNNIQVPSPLTGRMFPRARSASLLNWNFNWLWSECLNRRAEFGFTHFAMKHDDIEPLEPGWGNLFIEESERLGLDLISAVVPIKDDRGVTTTAIRDATTGRLRRLTMREVMRLPETFTINDVLEAGIRLDGDEVLLVNTGLWLARLDRPWVERFPGFHCHDEVRQDQEGKYRAIVMSEDWTASEWWNRRGVKYAATRKVPLLHMLGDKGFPNYVAWGSCETDPGD